jgi:hypothetical protein
LYFIAGKNGILGEAVWNSIFDRATGIVSTGLASGATRYNGGETGSVHP